MEVRSDKLIPCCFVTAPHAVVIPQPSKQTLSSGACGFTATMETSATTVYWENVDVPICTILDNNYLRICTHEVMNGLTIDGKTTGAVGHDTFTLSSSD